MLQYENQQECPPGGYTYRVDATNKLFHGWTLPAVVEEVRSHLEANKLPVPVNLQAVIEDYSCRSHPLKCYETDALKGFLSNMVTTLKTMASGVEVLAPWFRDGRPMVSLEQSDLRAGKCKQCPYHTTSSQCKPCVMPLVHDLVNKAVGPDRATRYPGLMACSRCGCALTAKVAVPIDYIIGSKLFNPEILPDWCWVITESR